MNEKPAAKTGIARIGAACRYSLAGLRSAISHEAAFRQELAIIAVLFGTLCLMPLSLFEKGLLFFASCLVLIVELLNSALESVVDLVSPDYHELAKRAKDLGSAAVFLSIAFASVLWGGAMLMILCP